MKDLCRCVLSVAMALSISACAPMHGVAFKAVPYPAKLARLSCGPGVCFVKVFARIEDDGTCAVKPEYDTIDVAAATTPNMLWLIDSIDHGNRYDYRFAFDPTATPKVYGIDILGNTPRDFVGPNYGHADKKSFMWQNVHGRSLPDAPFDYLIKVERSPRGLNQWSPCAVVDPRIINE